MATPGPRKSDGGRVPPPTGPRDIAEVSAARRLLPESAGSSDLDRSVGLAARLLGAPSAMVTLLTDVQTIASRVGTPLVLPTGSETPLIDSICLLTAQTGAPVAVPDARVDERLADNPHVRSGEIVAYLGAPLVADSGHVVGALCVFDTAARQWSAADSALLAELAASATADLELAALTREFDLSRARWDLAIEAADMGTFELDAVTGQLDWDDRLIELFGYRGRGDDEFDGSLGAVERGVHPDDIERVNGAIEEALANVGGIHVRYRVVLPDGRIRWLQARGHTVADEHGVAARMLGVTFDVTAQQDAIARTQHLLGSMAVGVMALDADFRVTWANREAHRITRIRTEDMIGRTMWELFPGTVGTLFEQTYRRVAETREPEMFEAFYPEPLDIWVEVRTVADDEGGLVLTFIDVTAQHDVQDLLQLSVDVGEALVRAPDIDSAVATLASMTVPRLADWAIVSLVEDDGRVRDVLSAHRDPASLPAVREYQARRLERGGSGIVQEVIASGEPMLVEDVIAVGRARLQTDPAKQALAALEPEYAAALPLVHDGRVFGVLTLYSGAQRSGLNPQELGVAMSICRRAAMAVSNRRMLTTLGETAAHDRSVAEALQEALLTRLPDVPGAWLEARYLPAGDREKVGGDWYDALVTRTGTLALMIGDVVGHDIDAAGAMGQMRNTMRTFAWDRDETPAALLQRVDAANAGLGMSTIASALAIQLMPSDAGSRALRWSSAGHPPPAVVRAGGAVELLDAPKHDTLLGVVPDSARRDHEDVLRSGDTLVLYTDGLVERRGEGLDAGLARLAGALAAHGRLPVGAMLDAVLSDLVGAHLADDVAVLAVRLD